MPFVVGALASVFTALGASAATASTLALTTLLTGITTGASIGIGFISKALHKQPSANNLTNSGYQTTIRQAIAPWRIIYGIVRTGGIFSYMKTIGANNEYLWMVITLAGHKVHAIRAMYFDNVAVTDSSAAVVGDWGTYISVLSYDLGDETNTTQPFPLLESESGEEWTENCLQRGKAKVAIKLRWDPDRYPNGLPNITFDVEGKEVYDPRDGTTHLSSNPALCLVDYMTDTQFGMGADYAEVNETALIAAANVCEEVITKGDSTTEFRYACDGIFETSQKPGDVINNILSAMGGYAIYAAGLWGIYAAAWRGSSGVEITDDDLAGPIQVQSRYSHRDTCNGVKGTYISPTNDWQPSDFPPYQNSSYVTEDNGEVLWHDIELPFTVSRYTAQRLAKIQLMRKRRQIQVTAKCKLSMYRIQAPDIVQITRSRFGWVSKLFEVTESTLAWDEEGDVPQLYVHLVMRETDAQIYAWTTAEEGDVAAIAPMTLPKSFPGAQASSTNVSFNTTNDATIDSVDAGTSASIRIYGPGGVGTNYTRYIGTVSDTRPSATITGKAFATKYYIVRYPDGFTHTSLTYAGTLTDTYEFIGSVTTVADGGSGGTSGGGGTGGSTGGRFPTT